MSKTTAQRVEWLLNNYPETRDSDKLLIIEYIKHSGLDLTDVQINILMDINFESIRRTRQKLQENGKYLPSPEVTEARYNKFKQVRSVISVVTPENTPELLENNRVQLGLI